MLGGFRAVRGWRCTSPLNVCRGSPSSAARAEEDGLPTPLDPVADAAASGYSCPDLSALLRLLPHLHRPPPCTTPRCPTAVAMYYSVVILLLSGSASPQHALGVAAPPSHRNRCQIHCPRARLRQCTPPRVRPPVVKVLHVDLPCSTRTSPSGGWRAVLGWRRTVRG